LNSSESEQFERAYRRIWMAFMRGDEPGLSQHERQLLHHVPEDGGTPLHALARHLALPKSTASVLVKDLERRGFLTRARDPRDERRLAIVLSEEGAARVKADTVLDVDRLGRAFAKLPAQERRELLRTIEKLADAGERLA
jgi:DNA-binding MarR family transcriptional regulator